MVIIQYFYILFIQFFSGKVQFADVSIYIFIVSIMYQIISLSETFLYFILYGKKYRM